MDFDRKELRLSNAKSGITHYTLLSTEAIGFINKIQKLKDILYLFRAARKEEPFINISKSWLRIRKETELVDVRIHDLRRTVGSWLAQSGKIII